MLTTTEGYPLSFVIATRIDTFFKFHDTNIIYKILKIFFYVFTVPFILISIAELVGVTTFIGVGKFICTALTFTIILPIILSAVFGLVYQIIQFTFVMLYFFFVLPEIIFGHLPHE